MKRTTNLVLLLAALQLALSTAAAAQSRVIDTCKLLGTADIRRLAGRNDVATSAGDAEDAPTVRHSNCIYSGAFDIGITVNQSDRQRFAQMRDLHVKAPPAAGKRVEAVRGLGDESYYMIDRTRVMLQTLVGDRELSVALQMGSGMQNRPTEPQAKAIALALTKAVLPKVR